MPASFPIGRIFGIRIEINYSWLIILVLLAASLALGWLPSAYRGWSLATYWIVAIIAALLLFVSVLAHELAHSVVARARNLPVKNITLFIFGGVSNIEQEPQSAGTEFQLTIVGPLTSLIIGVVCWLIGMTLASVNVYVSAVFVYLGVTNLLLGVFNLIPGFPLDGGRVLRSIIWGITGDLRRATRWTTSVGTVVAVLFIVFGIWLFFMGDVLGGIWIGFIGWFLLSAGQAANTQVMVQSLLRGVHVGDLMTRQPLEVPEGISLRHLVDEYFLPFGLRTALIAQDDRLRGLVTLSDVRRVPAEDWGQVTVAQVMTPAERLHVVSPTQNLNDVLPLLAHNDINQVPVVEDGRLVGLLSRDAIMRYIELRRQIGHDSGWPGGTGKEGPLPKAG